MQTDRPSFLTLYCRRWRVPQGTFVRDLLRRAAYPHARPFLALLKRMRPGYFDPDYEFIADIAQLRRRTDFSEAAESYITHPANRGWLRQRFRLRVSVRRMLQLVEEVLPQSLPADLRERLEAKDSLTPFEPGKTPSSEEAKPETDQG